MKHRLLIILISVILGICLATPPPLKAAFSFSDIFSSSEQSTSVKESPLDINQTLTPHERFIRGQIKSIFRKYATKQGEPPLTISEEFFSWVSALGILYSLGRLKDIRKLYLVPLLALDSIVAINNYPIYKSLGHYPPIDYVKLPSVSMGLGIGILHIWKRVRSIMERTLLGQHKNLIEISLTDFEETELDSTTIRVIENQCLELKQELHERDLYKYLYLAGPEIVQRFEELDYLSSESGENDYYKAFRLLGLVQKIIAFIRP